MADSLLSLPLVSAPPEETPVSWNGLTPIASLFSASPGELASAAPEPQAPQGEYSTETAAEPLLSFGQTPLSTGRVELLAPAGGPDAAYAAFHYGADAVYLGLKKFSARAEAENFTLDEVAELTAYAHSLQPRRRVFVTVNTLVRQDELAELVDD